LASDSRFGERVNEFGHPDAQQFRVDFAAVAPEVLAQDIRSTGESFWRNALTSQGFALISLRDMDYRSQKRPFGSVKVRMAAGHLNLVDLLT
jgi:hypothetical protein